MNAGVMFLKGFLKNPRRVGAIFQSSRFLIAKIMKHVEIHDGDCVVEMGAGLGCVTERLLQIMPKDAKLLSFELNPEFVKHLQAAFTDPRLVIIQDKAQNLPQYLEKYGFKKADIVVSIVPLRHPQARDILRTVKGCLKEDGRYIQVALVGQEVLGEFFTYMKQEITFLNIPPEKVHFCLNSGPSRPSQTP